MREVLGSSKWPPPLFLLQTITLHAQRFLSAFGVISSHFRVGRHLYTKISYRAVMKTRFAVWEEVTSVALTAKTRLICRQIIWLAAASSHSTSLALTEEINPNPRSPSHFAILPW